MQTPPTADRPAGDDPGPAAAGAVDVDAQYEDTDDTGDSGDSGDSEGDDTEDDGYEDDDEPASVPSGRAGHSTRDMTISLLALLVPLAIVFVISRLLGGGDAVVVDPAPAISEAAAAFPIGTPHGLASGWRPISATFGAENGGRALRIGYVTPAGGAVQLIESTEAADGLLVRELGDNTRPTGPVLINGTAWRSFDVRTNEKALVRTGSGRTDIVIGKAGPDELQTLATAVS